MAAEIPGQEDSQGWSRGHRSGREKDAPASDPNNVDAVTGATLTSNGVDAMLKEGLAKFIK